MGSVGVVWGLDMGLDKGGIVGFSGWILRFLFSRTVPGGRWFFS
jgi:hypothetical protein